MSLGAELRAARLRELHQTLVSKPIASRYRHLFHAGIRSDDVVLQSLIDENCADDIPIPSFISDPVLDDEADWGKVFLFAELLARLNSARKTDARALRHKLWESVWQAAICGPGSQIKGFGIHWSEWASDVWINGLRWSSRIVSDDDERLDDDTLDLRLEEFGNLLRSETLALRTVDQPNGYNVAIGWIELIYSLFPQAKKTVSRIQTIMLPWNLSEASARAVEVLIDRPDWRFDQRSKMQPATRFTPAELCRRLGEMSPERLAHYAGEAKVMRPGRGERHFQYDVDSASAVCRTIINSTATTPFKTAARTLLQELTGETVD